MTLSILLVLYPIVSLWEDDPTAILRSLNQGALIFLLVFTVLTLWIIFLFIYVTTYFEGTGLAGLGLGRIRLLDFAWAGAFFLAAWTFLTGLAWLLARMGMEIPGEVGLLIPQENSGKLLWVVVSFTAGFCEEIAYRGYLMTRLRILGRFKTWVVPIIISALAFGVGHAYQGIPGLILITIYGALFSLLYVRTGRLWPCIIAHFFQDFGALFLPQ